MNPETQKTIETLHYRLEHNLPVKREVSIYLFIYLFISYQGNTTYIYTLYNIVKY